MLLASGRVIAQAVNLMSVARRPCLGLATLSAVRSPPRLRSIARSTVYRRCLCSKKDDEKLGKDTENVAENDEVEDEQKTKTDNDVVSPLLRDKFLLFEDRDSEVILDIHEEFEQMRDGTVLYPGGPGSLLEKQRDEHNLERGLTGVYDIEDLVSVLEAENASDICVIRMPPELIYADYMVIANGRSARHLEAMMQFIRKLYKKKKHKSDKVANVQGEASRTWKALDMGNIVLHLMMPEDRDRFDIETLWAVGEKYDDNTVKPQDTEASSLQAHLDFLDSWRPLQEEETSTQ